MSTIHKFSLLSVKSLFALAAASFATIAVAAGLAGPSAITVGEPAVFRGSNFTPNTAVRMTVTDPSGRSYSQVVGVNADGSFSYAMSVNAGGIYRLQASNSQGQVLAKGSLAVAQ